jgi:hypothetical protein
MNQSFNTRQRIIISTCVGILVIVIGLFIFHRDIQAPTLPNTLVVETFEQCVVAGYPIVETYPEQCRTPDGRNFTRVTPVVTAAPVTLTGIYDCLPKKTTGGPVTMECAFGLHTDKGEYALDLSSIPTKDYPAIKTGDKITVEGILVPPEAVSRDRWTTYDVSGIIAVEKIVD